ncbi:MAG: Coenzyme F420 hydrogenase/dehydrogenase, beta subunit C-terminal domain [Methanomicrobiales archaeon]|nr:Coenzyme F420 hydrogenase/dehydrogenase, beta subunit C-terminal domain [Methanomicrobiales archaeon]
MAKKSYRNLKDEVWDQGLCSGCGACVAVCPADALHFPALDPGTAPFPPAYCKEDTDGVPCGACVAVCPRTRDRVPKQMLGEYREIWPARAGFDVPRRQSGGAVSAILSHALEEGLIDAVVTIAEDRFTLLPRSVVITSQEALVHEAGSRYQWWVPLLASLKEAVVEKKYRRVAVIGVPCAIQALRLMKESDHPLVRPFGRSIRLLLGLFCTETFDYRVLVEEILGKGHGVAPWEVKRLDVKGKLEVTLEGERSVVLPLKNLEAAVRPGCHACTDLTAVDADISAGAVGSPKGFTTVIVRTPGGKAFVDRALASGRLEKGEGGVDLAAIEKLAAVKAKRRKMPTMPEK